MRTGRESSYLDRHFSSVRVRRIHFALRLGTGGLISQRDDQRSPHAHSYRLGLNQIVLSQELGSLDDLYDRTKGTFDVHQQIGDTTNVSVSSPQASEFFLQLSNAINNRAVELEAASENVTDEQLQEEISDYAETLTEQIDDISADLEDLGFELTDTLIVLLDYHD
ncbi:hypothetical protein [Natrinema sp. DC36]|uniref:hypothetical protein n=1 Tax=Natrinema sp. DC36 TaxID=2878680 RepID=UPI001CF0B45D|nr:hypothetical protein [Natrinema sp. DC36]